MGKSSRLKKKKTERISRPYTNRDYDRLKMERRVEIRQNESETALRIKQRRTSLKSDLEIRKRTTYLKRERLEHLQTRT